MKFLLVGINSKYIHSNPAIHYLKLYAGEEYQNTVELAEYTINHLKEQILSDIYRRRPDAVGISCYIWNFRMVQELLPEIHKVLPGRDIWLGGPEVSFEGEEVLAQFPYVTGIMTGEGEETFRELLSCYRDEKDYHGVKGLLLPDGFTGSRRELSMDELPFLYTDLQEYENRILYYETSRGCPFQCTYCLSSIERKVRLRSHEKVEQELSYFLAKKVPQVKFVDRTFNCNREHALFIWNYIREHDNGVTNFHFEVAADIMNEEQLAALAAMRPGLVQLEIGIQTTNDKTLHEINRYVDTRHIAGVVAKLREPGNIHIHLDLIAGLPYEDYESFGRSFDEVYVMKPEQLQLGFLKVLKGTEISLRKEEYGLVHQSIPPYEVLYTKWISYEEIRKLKRVEEMVELYYNSNQFIQTLAVLVTQVKTPFDLYEKLAEHYETHGYFINTPARVKRYDVLFEFACRLVPERKELFRELLTFDFYLRENAKSRPAFCRDLTGDYEMIRQFYEQEEAEPHYLKEYAQYHARQVMKITHMEMFHYPVWQQDADEWKPLEHPVMVLYDYQKRDPLTGDCAAVPCKTYM